MSTEAKAVSRRKREKLSSSESEWEGKEWEGVRGVRTSARRWEERKNEAGG